MLALEYLESVLFNILPSIVAYPSKKWNKEKGTKKKKQKVKGRLKKEVGENVELVGCLFFIGNLEPHNIFKWKGNLQVLGFLNSACVECLLMEFSSVFIVRD